MVSTMVIGNCVAAISAYLNVITGRERDKKRICIYNTIASCLSTGVNLLFGAFAGAGLSAMTILRAQLVMRDKLNKVTFTLMIATSITVSIFIMEGPRGWLAVLGSSLSSLGYYRFQKSEKDYRTLRLMANIPGGVYYFLCGNFVSLSVELYNVVQNIKTLRAISKAENIGCEEVIGIEEGIGRHQALE